ncbi:cell wall hydrolase [Flavisphingomonas formosensis]|uniref:cell wall hydrolase n=1 Tax=Flavisphingomonas formosensis TaxID=861534 RepID=UPI002FCD1B16
MVSIFGFGLIDRMAKRRARGRSSARGKAVRRGSRRRRSSLQALFTFILLGAVVLAIGIPVLNRHFENKREERKEALSMEQARAINAAIPFVKGRGGAAPPYFFRGTPAARLQATDCLATAALYEAGADVRGQRAVMQVILNRVRAPGFPKTVCGVVYQGSQRKTGCQFSFTCDGSRQRRPERTGWVDARLRARHALAGTVFKPVGMATHYHTDWIVPYWISSLDKIAKVHSHIFYRPAAARTS